jgi:hypothetical protein
MARSTPCVVRATAEYAYLENLSTEVLLKPCTQYPGSFYSRPRSPMLMIFLRSAS